MFKSMIENTRLLELAIAGLQAERRKIDEEIHNLTSQLNPAASSAARKSGVQTANGSKGAPQSRVNARKGGMTAAGRRRLSELAKKRWAAARKSGKTTL
jgi:hypothetical protein